MYSAEKVTFSSFPCSQGWQRDVHRSHWEELLEKVLYKRLTELEVPPFLPYAFLLLLPGIWIWSCCRGHLDSMRTTWRWVPELKMAEEWWKELGIQMPTFYLWITSGWEMINFYLVEATPISGLYNCNQTQVLKDIMAPYVPILIWHHTPIHTCFSLSLVTLSSLPLLIVLLLPLICLTWHFQCLDLSTAITSQGSYAWLASPGQFPITGSQSTTSFSFVVTVLIGIL